MFCYVVIPRSPGNSWAEDDDDDDDDHNNNTQKQHLDKIGRNRTSIFEQRKKFKILKVWSKNVERLKKKITRLNSAPKMMVENKLRNEE